MSTTTAARNRAARKGAAAAVDADYLALVRRFPLRPMRGDDDYDRAAEVLDGLVGRDLSEGEQDYLDALTLMVEAYDDTHYRIEPDRRPPVAWLKALMTALEVTPTELQKILGVAQSTVSMILGGKRGLSKTSIATLAERFKLEPGYFM
jgi:HTH-type transcriptional regulator / antitoxin HigA